MFDLNLFIYLFVDKVEDKKKSQIKKRSTMGKEMDSKSQFKFKIWLQVVQTYKDVS